MMTSKQRELSAKGNIVGFSVLKVSAFRKKLLSISLKNHIASGR